jgi:hypothetical protein
MSHPLHLQDTPIPDDPAGHPELRMRPWLRLAVTIGFSVFLFVGIPVILIRGTPPASGRDQAVRIAAIAYVSLFCIVTPLSLWVPGRGGLTLKRAAAGLLGFAFVIGATETLLGLAGFLPKGSLRDLEVIAGLFVVGIPCLAFAIRGTLLFRPRSA